MEDIIDQALFIEFDEEHFHGHFHAIFSLLSDWHYRYFLVFATEGKSLSAECCPISAIHGPIFFSTANLDKGFITFLKHTFILGCQ